MSKIHSRELPEWMNTFIATFSKGQEKEVTASEKTAEINVKDLPKVVWNDETFYAMFDETGATVMNEFGNTVTTIKGANTIEAVDQHLNGKQVVTSEIKENSILEEEMKKVSTYLSDVEAEEQKTDEFGNPVQETEETEEVQQPNADTDQTEQDVNDLEQDVNGTSASLDMAARMAEMESQMAGMAEQIKTLQEQLHAYTDPGNVYDLNVQQSEQQHFEESAQESAQQIEVEHSVDLTTMDGRVSLVDKLKNDIDTIMNTDETELDVQELELPEETPVEETEETTEEAPATEEELVEIELPEIEEPADTTETEEAPAEEAPVEEAPATEEEAPAEEKDEEKPEPGSNDEQIVKLNSRDSKIFKERICPECGEKSLKLANKVEHMQGIFCTACNTEFGVDTNTEDIYKQSK